jgi:phosphoglycerate dehydrogenase-like enzyme
MSLVLYTGPEHSLAIIKRILGNKFEVERVEAEPEKLYPYFKKCTVFLDASMKVPITKVEICEANDLRLIVTATTGANHIDQNALKIRNIPILTLKGQKEVLRNLTPAAEHSWLLLMACARKLRGSIHHVEEDKWNRIDFPGVMLKGKTIGIIGMGRIGSWMAKYAFAFDMRVLAYDPFTTSFPDGVILEELESLVQTSDFITLHVNLTEDTKGLLTSKIIEKFKPGCVFINTSRGELVDEIALINGLKHGSIAAVGVDVLTDEPQIETNPLWQYAQNNYNVIITPHIGGFSPEAVDKVVEFSCIRILDYFGGVK